MENEKRAKFYGDKIIELASLIKECLDEDDFDGAGALNVELIDYVAKLDLITDELI